MTDSFVPPVAPPPSTYARAAEKTQTTRDIRPLPLTELASLPHQGSLICRIAAVDSQGRIAEQSAVHTLGWSPGQRLDIGVISGTIVVRADPTGVFTLARRRHIPIPAAVRRWCALRPGQRVLLAVAAEQDVLLIHTMVTLEAMLRTHYACLLGGDLP